MNKTPAEICPDYPENRLAQLRQSLEDGLRARHDPSPVPVFFRADDIGVISNAFVRLMALFERYQIPLCLAVVPAWLTVPRWSAMSRICDTGSALWCWHQHGWQHRNHQCSGKERVWFGSFCSSNQGGYHQRPQQAPGVARQSFFTVFHTALEPLQQGNRDRASRGRIQGNVNRSEQPAPPGYTTA